jgi:hypothetical protein
MPRGTRRLRSGATLLLLVALAAGCGGDGEARVSEAEFTGTMIDRFGATEDQAECITHYVFADYAADEIDLLAEEGMGALPQPRWGPYLNASAACITVDQPLVGDP